jgi:hypothetical protein
MDTDTIKENVPLLLTRESRSKNEYTTSLRHVSCDISGYDLSATNLRRRKAVHHEQNLQATQLSMFC